MLQQSIAFIFTILKGLGQIMLQENAATGLLFLTGLYYGSITMGSAAILSVCCATIAAQLLKYDKTEIEKGLYGFSAALVGVALILFFGSSFIVWLFIIIGSIVAAIVQHFFIVKRIPVFTLPFVLVTWIIMLLFQYFLPGAPPMHLSTGIPIGRDFAFALRGFGEVIFQGSVFAGVAFFIGVFINSPLSALYGIAGALVAALLSYWLSAPIAAVEMGLFSYNAVLCAIVFAGDKSKDGFWVMLSVSLSVIISLMMFKYTLIQLTFPFVAATCITLAFRNAANKIWRQKRASNF